MKKCIIIGAGEVSSAIARGEDDFVIAADGGFLTSGQQNIICDLVVGDFDSLGRFPDHPNVIRHPAEKDDTDTMLAVNEGFRRGFDTFVIYGGLGGRLGHSLANIQTICDIAKKGGRAYLVGDDTVATAIYNSSISFSSEESGYISVFSMTDKSIGVYEKGLKYELSDATLSNTEPLGVSNEFCGRESEISVEKGILVLIWQNKNFII